MWLRLPDNELVASPRFCLVWRVWPQGTSQFPAGLGLSCPHLELACHCIHTRVVRFEGGKESGFGSIQGILRPCRNPVRNEEARNQSWLQQFAQHDDTHNTNTTSITNPNLYLVFTLTVRFFTRLHTFFRIFLRLLYPH